MKLPILFTSVFLGSILLPKEPSTDNNPIMVRKTEMKPAKRAILPVGKISIVIDKSDYELSIYDDKGWFATYPCVFGNNSLDDKKMEGDRKTPEGVFHILSKRIHDKWDRFMSLDYPTKESYDKFIQRKQHGEIPSNARIGGSIGIHGTWPHDDFMIDQYKNWTLGCISLKNIDVEEIYTYVQPGTKVTIRK